MDLNERINKVQAELDQLKSQVKETEVVVVLDRSGSMQTNKSDHEGGLKAFVQKQRELPGKVFFTFAQFDDQNPFEVIYDRVPINDVGEVSLNPRGTTPLRDAIGRGINHVANRAMGDIIFLIVSDGQENSSKEYSQAQIKKMVEDKKEAGWQFVFVGTNFDVITAGTNVGFDPLKNVMYNNNTASIHKAYSYTANKVNDYRELRSAGMSYQASSVSLDFCDSELNEIKEAK